MADKKAERLHLEIVRRDAHKLCDGVNGQPALLVPNLVARGRVLTDYDGNPRVEYQSIIGDWHVSGPDMIAEMKRDEDFGPLFRKPLKPQTGLAPAEPNPFKPGSGWSLTKQFWLLRNDPARAAALKAEIES